MKPTKEDREAAEEIRPTRNSATGNFEKGDREHRNELATIIARRMAPERRRARRETVVRQALADEVRKSQPNHPAVFISDAFDRAAAEALSKEEVT